MKQGNAYITRDFLDIFSLEAQAKGEQATLEAGKGVAGHSSSSDVWAFRLESIDLPICGKETLKKMAMPGVAKHQCKLKEAGHWV